MKLHFLLLIGVSCWVTGCAHTRSYPLNEDVYSRLSDSESRIVEIQVRDADLLEAVSTRSVSDLQMKIDSTTWIDTGNGTTRTVVTERIEYVTVSRRDHKTGMWFGLGVGALGGGLATSFIGYGLGDDCSSEDPACQFPRKESAIYGALLGVAAGGFIGAAMGYRDGIRVLEEYVRNSNGTARLSLAPVFHRGVRPGLCLRVSLE